MRDPEAELRFSGDKVIRNLRKPLDRDHFLRSDLARRWQERGDLIGFEVLNDHTLVAPRIPFVSFPTEWCDLLLYQAAELTLRLQQEAVEDGFDLKDASAWNVISYGGRAVFCDLLSFVPLTQKRWWAAGQFARHFILPLLISQRRGLPAYKAFHAWCDGMPHNVAGRMLGAGRFWTRYWPLIAGGAASTPPTGSSDPGAKVCLDDIRRFRARLNLALDWMLRGVNPCLRASGASTTWENYINERNHYADCDLDAKRERVAQWVKELAPGRVLDLGCNSGEFSRLAADAGANVVALDADHGAISHGVAHQSSRINYLVASLEDLRGGFGWNATEFPGLPMRLLQYADLTLMLALLHHLVLGASIPLQEVAKFAAACTRRWLVVELIAPEDVQVGALQVQRNRYDPFPTMDIQEAAFAAAGFELRERHPLSTGTRTLVLMERAV